jgi:hypothetical protein
MSKTADTGLQKSQFEHTPEGWAKLWALELNAADDAVRDWHTGAEIILQAYLDQRKGAPEDPSGVNASDATHLNFFWANVATQRDMMFGRLPEVDVTRRYGDSDDDEGRIAGPLILERILDTDIETGTDGFQAALRNALLDFLIVGFGNAWVRYDAEFKDKPAIKRNGKEAAPAARMKVHEDAPVEYFYWKHQRWSPCRTFEDMRWSAKMVEMTSESMEERFGETGKEAATFDAEERQKTSGKTGSEYIADPWTRTEVWEIWSKEHRKVFWYVRGFYKVLDVKDDFLKLKGFWPHPRPLFSNLTTSALMPRPDYAMVQDLYRDINILATRIVILEQALRVAGVYDRNAGELHRLLEDTPGRNIMIPVDGWADKVEGKAGLEAVISWLPLDQVVSALDKLTQKLQEKQQLLYELTGQSDLSRGSENSAPGGPETATSVRAQVKYGSIRVQAKQDEFARFTSELAAIRAEIMVKNFDEAELLKRSNVLFTPDAPEALAAVRMLKAEFPNYRVEIKPEAIAMTDFASMKAERAEFLMALASVLRDAAPVIQVFPPLAPALLETLKWTLAGFRGSASIEGVWDKALKQAKDALAQGGGQQGPDPEAMKEFAKGQADMAKTQAKLQADLMKIQAQVQGEQQKQQIQAEQNIREAEMNAQIKQRERAGELAHVQAKNSESLQFTEARGRVQEQFARRKAAMQPKRPSKGKKV